MTGLLIQMENSCNRGPRIEPCGMLYVGMTIQFFKFNFYFATLHTGLQRENITIEGNQITKSGWEALMETTRLIE